MEQISQILEYKLYYLNANGIKTRVLEPVRESLLFYCMAQVVILKPMQEISEVLSENFRVIVIDMVGHGYTEKPDQPYGIDYYSDHLLELFKH